MDYEKAYKEALDIARNLMAMYPQDAPGYKEVFPELAESEDERIRVRDFMMKQFFRPISPDLADALADAILKVEKTALNKKQKESLHISESCKEKADSFTQEIPMPNSTTLLKMWDDEEKMLREKEIEDRWRLAYNAFLDGFAQGMMVKQKEQKPLEMPSPSVIYTEQGDVLAEQKPASTEDMPYITDEHFYERAPADSFKYKLAEYMTKGCTKKEGSYGYTYAISAETILKMAEEELLKRGVVQKPDIELIQRSWYMEGYHDREFGMEPRWIIRTGEGGPKHELNPRYGQHLTEQQVTEEQLHDLNEAIKGLRMDGCERMADSLHSLYDILTKAQKPAEWSEKDEDRIRQIERIAQQAGCTQKLQVEIHDWLKSLRPQPKVKWSEEDEKMLNEVLDSVTYAFYDQGKEGEIEDDPAFLWLHRLRPSWKPSEEQMEALESEIKYCYACGLHEGGRKLQSLYEQLKKLM